MSMGIPTVVDECNETGVLWLQRTEATLFLDFRHTRKGRSTGLRAALALDNEGLL